MGWCVVGVPCAVVVPWVVLWVKANGLCRGLCRGWCCGFVEALCGFGAVG